MKKNKSIEKKIFIVPSADVGVFHGFSNLPDLILLDIMMPEISGWDVLDIIKSNENWKKIPVILLTALAQEKDIKMGMEKQVDGYITKPFEKKYLLEKVNELILKMQKKDDK